MFNCVAPTPSSSVTDVFTSLLSSQSTISNTGPVPMTTSPSANTITSTSELTSTDSLPPTSSSSQSSSSSSSIITTTNTPTTGLLTDNIAFIGAGVICVVLITLAIFLIVICVLIRINRQKDKSNKKRSSTLQSDSLDFHRGELIPILSSFPPTLFVIQALPLYYSSNIMFYLLFLFTLHHREDDTTRDTFHAQPISTKRSLRST